MSPKKIDVIEHDCLKIIWDDDSLTKIKLANLRENCPCAECISEKEKRGKMYIPIFQKDETSVLEIKPVGMYALNIIWKDGHSSGIYEYDYLRKLK